MGGYGFSAFAGVRRLYVDYIPAATYEGDNFVLDTQVVRAALKVFARVASFAPAPNEAYLRWLADPDADADAAVNAGHSVSTRRWSSLRNMVAVNDRRGGGKYLEAGSGGVHRGQEGGVVWCVSHQDENCPRVHPSPP